MEIKQEGNMELTIQDGINSVKLNTKKWVSVESMKDLLNKDNLCYITKERLLKELEEE